MSLTQITETPVPVAAASDATTPDTAANPANSTQYAALAQKEKKIRQAQLAIQQEREAMKAKEAEYQTKYIPRDKLADKESLWATLQELGHSAQDLLEMGLNPPAGKDPALTGLEAKFKALEEKQERAAKAQADAQTQQYDQAVNQIRNDVKLLVDSDANYETIKQMGATEAVVELIKQTFDKSGELLTVEKASQQVEDHLLDEAIKMASLSKVKAKLAPAPVDSAKRQQQGLFSVTQKQVPATTPPQQQQIKTLTNAQAASTSTALSAKEKRERAILAFKGQLG